jgi:hypothetical protein
MTAPAHPPAADPRCCDEQALAAKARRVLRRLAEPGAVMAIAPDMDKAACCANFPMGACAHGGAGTVRRPGLCAEGLDRLPPPGAGLDLRDHLGRPRRAEADGRRGGRAVRAGRGAAPFADQHRDWGDREVMEDGGPRRVRYNMAESPVVVLGGGATGRGKPFLSPNWWRPPNGCARISNWRRWARAWRRTGTGS